MPGQDASKALCRMQVARSWRGRCCQVVQNADASQASPASAAYVARGGHRFLWLRAHRDFLWCASAGKWEGEPRLQIRPFSSAPRSSTRARPAHAPGARAQAGALPFAQPAPFAPLEDCITGLRQRQQVSTPTRCQTKHRIRRARCVLRGARAALRPQRMRGAGAACPERLLGSAAQPGRTENGYEALQQLNGNI